MICLLAVLWIFAACTVNTLKACHIQDNNKNNNNYYCKLLIVILLV